MPVACSRVFDEMLCVIGLLEHARFSHLTQEPFTTINDDGKREAFFDAK